MLMGREFQVSYRCLLNTFSGFYGTEVNFSDLYQKTDQKTVSEDPKLSWRGCRVYVEVNRNFILRIASI